MSFSSSITFNVANAAAQAIACPDLVCPYLSFGNIEDRVSASLPNKS